MKQPIKFGKFLYRLLITIGLFTIFFPFASQTYYQYISKQETNQFEKECKKVNPYEIRHRIELAKAYNRTLSPAKLGDPFTNKEKAGIAEYARMIQLQEKIGYITIPKIDQKIPCRAGTSEDVLQKGAGHLEGTSLPIGGKGTHTVITAHRGLPTERLFTDLNKLKIGDFFYITNIKETLAYKVDQILIVEPDDFTPILVDDYHDYATLLTCTPYMINSHRLLVRGERINLPKRKVAKDSQINFFSQYKWFIVIMSLFLLGIIVYLICRLICKKGRKL